MTNATVMARPYSQHFKLLSSALLAYVRIAAGTCHAHTTKLAISILAQSNTGKQIAVRGTLKMSVLLQFLQIALG